MTSTLSGLPFIHTLLEFQRAFPDEQACLAYLEKVRWPDGFTCPACGAVGEPYRISARPRVLVCRSCREETSLTAGTAMHRAKMPMQLWFWAAYLMTSQTPGMSAIQFRRQLGIKRYETAFQMLHKLRAAMVNPERTLIGKGIDWETKQPKRYPVELDEAYVGGRTRSGKQGLTNKVIVVGAVELRESKKKKIIDPTSGVERGRLYAGRMRLRLVPDRGKKALTTFASDNIEPGTTVRTDDWISYEDLWKWFDHEVVRPEEPPESKGVVLDMPRTKTQLAKERGERMPLIHLVFSNLKSWLLGTHHGVSPKHLQAYLNEYVFRFNRRFYPMSGFHALLNIAVGRRGPEYEGIYRGTWAHPNPDEEEGWLI